MFVCTRIPTDQDNKSREILKAEVCMISRSSLSTPDIGVSWQQ